MTAAAPAPVRRGVAVPVVIRLTVLVLLATGVAACSSDGSGPPSHAAGPNASQTSTSKATTTSGRTSGPSAGCHATPVVPAGTTDEVLTSNGVERHYQLIVPADYDGTKPFALIFGLHSLTVDYHIVAPMTGFGDMAGSYDFIAVSPSGLLGPSGKPYWNAASVPDNGDVTFLTDLLDHLERTLCIDRSRVFSVGMSNGAQMSSLLACRLDGRIAGIAAISGVEYGKPCDGPPVGVIAFHGLQDPIVRYRGGGLDSVAISNANLYHGNLPPGTVQPRGVDAAMTDWARHNGCRRHPVETRVSPEVRKRVWQDCDAPTVLYIVDNGGHAWPGKPQPMLEPSWGHGTTDIDASTLLFRFLFDHQV